MNKTQIEWVLNPDGSPGFTWNPITGCLNGCDYCYARRLANTRLRERYLANQNVAYCYYRGKELIGSPELLGKCDYSDPFYPRFWEDRLKQLPKGCHKPIGVFTCDMSDLFGIGIPEDWTQKVLQAIRWHPELRFYLLTKQPQNLAKFSPFPDNCWVGVTITDGEADNTPLAYMREVEASIKYISFEPLLNWSNFKGREEMLANSLKTAGINWVIIGATTFRGSVIGHYPQLTPMKYGRRDTLQPKIEWVHEIIRACDKASVAVFLKNNLQPLFPGHELRQEIPV